MKKAVFSERFIGAFMAGIISCAGILGTSSSFAEEISINTVDVSTSAVLITESRGWYESAYVEWTSYAGAEGYNVYVKPEEGGYTKLDDMLVRQYADYLRADALGLAKGSYVMKVVPVKGGNEITSAAAETPVLNVDSYLREGFAFSEASPNKYTTGAYNKDGTLKADAEVVYLTDANRNTVTINGNSSKGVGINGIIAYRNKNKIDTPLSVRVLGKVRAPENINADYTMRIENNKNVTFEGVGEDAVLHGWGISIKRTQNIEFRNFAIMWHCQGTDGDALSFDTENYNVFIHNMDFYYGAPGAEDDQKKGDGTIDMKHQTDYVTVSNNHFYDTGKTTFSGGQWELNNMTDTTAKVNVTYHHNWFDHADSRHPRCVVGNTHVYNNYYVGNGYGAAACEQASVFVENNYFENCDRPMMIGSQGSDSYRGNGVFEGSKNLSNQDGGMIKEYGNYMTGYSTFFNQNNTPVAGQIDGYSVTSQKEQVPSNVTAVKGGWAYNNFDTAVSMYSYTPDEAEAVKEKVINNAGRLNGGDLKWTFTDADNNSGNIIEGLKNAVMNYESQLVKAGGEDVKGEEISTESTTEVTTEAPKEGKLEDDYVWDLSKISTTPENNIWCGEAFSAGKGNNTYYDDNGCYYVVNGYVSSDNSPKTADNLSPKGGTDIPVTGCYVGIKPIDDGTITVAMRTGTGKVSYVTGNGETLKVIDNSAGANRFDVIKFNVKKDITYYIYTSGSKARYAYIGFTADSNTTTELTTELKTELTTEATTEATTENDKMLWGDADNNKKVDILDAALVLNYTLAPEKSNIPESILKYIDVSRNGKVESDDAAMILQNILDGSFDIGNN